MKTKSSLLFVLCILPSFILAQKIDNLASFRDIQSSSYFRFNYDNDYFAATDENYTQGYSFELVSNSLQRNPANYLFYKPKKGGHKYGIAIEHIGFTPNDYVSENIQFGDRPFAAAIMLKSFLVITDTFVKSRFSQSFSLGVIGPGAFGKEMQVEIHRATGNKPPGGWDNQVKNDLVLNYRFDYEKQLLSYDNFFSLQSNSTLQLGTLYSSLSAGINSTIGLINSPFDTPLTKNRFKLYLYSQSLVNAIAYDATLQGGLFNNKSVYTIANNNIERFTAQFNYGLVLKTQTFYFEYARSIITREFKTGKSAKWGGLKIGFTF